MRMKRPARLNIGIDLVDPSELPIEACIAAMGEPAGSIARSTYTAAQAAQMLGCSLRSLYRWEKAGVIPAAKRVERGQVPARVYTVSEVEAIRKITHDRVDFAALTRESGERRRRETAKTQMSAETAESRDARSRSTSTENGADGSARRNARGQLEAGPLAETNDWRSPSPPAESGEPSSFRFFQADGIQWLEQSILNSAKDRRVLIYCDPPYLMETRSGRKLYEHEMTMLQHRRLLRCLQDLPCMVMISGYSHPLYAQMLKSWNATSYQTTTRGGKPVAEWIWYNFPRPVELHDYRFLGDNFRERERIKRKKKRWTARLDRMPLLERQALLCAIAESAGFGDTGSARRI